MNIKCHIFPLERDNYNIPELDESSKNKQKIRSSLILHFFCYCCSLIFIKLLKISLSRDVRSKELEAGGGAAALQGVGIQAVVTECLICYCDIIFSDKMPSYSSLDSSSECIDLEAVTPGHSHLATHTWPLTPRHSHLATHTWPLTPGHSHLATHTWPLTPGHSHLATHTWPLTPGHSHLATHTWPLTPGRSHLTGHTKLVIPSLELKVPVGKENTESKI